MEDIVLSQLFSRKSLSSSVMREEVRRDSTVMFSSRSRDFRKSASLLLNERGLVHLLVGVVQGSDLLNDVARLMQDVSTTIR